VEVSELESYVEAMKRLGLVRLRWKAGDREVELERESVIRAPAPGLQEVIQAILPEPAEASSAPTPAAELVISSPLVGTFYSRPAPSRAPFVEPGQRIQPDTVVAIVEAMKVMNEIKAGVHGWVTSCPLNDGDPVEFGTPLIVFSAESPCAKS
jgi:acetyl-CoA carboxylase biotin carboxyl carrier protein